MTITISNDDLHTANKKLALRVADLERDRDVLAGEAGDAQELAKQFMDERDLARDQARTERIRADALDAAVPALVAEHVRREEKLQAELRAARRIITGLEGLLGDYYGANWRLGEHVARLVAENQALLARPWWRRKR